jgi:hypothetical protein
MRTTVRLRILSSGVSPEGISEQLGVRPDHVWYKGVPDGKTPANMLKVNGWILNSGASEDVPADKQIRMLLAKLESRGDQLKTISSTETVDVSCVIYSDTAPPLYFEKEIMQTIASLGANFDIDLYPSLEAAEPSEVDPAVKRKSESGAREKKSRIKSGHHVV